eukprot:6183415-Pleurochrysis_carterae.AAC.1
MFASAAICALLASPPTFGRLRRPGGGGGDGGGSGSAGDSGGSAWSEGCWFDLLFSASAAE